MKKLSNLIILFLTITVVPVFGQVKNTIFSPQDTIIFKQYVRSLASKRQLPVDNIIIRTAEYLMDAPYVAKTLEACGRNERLVVNLRQFDCVTFVENCLALSNTIKSKHPTFSGYCNELRELRYRSGEIAGYSSRLHYFTDWIADNEKKGKVINLSREFGGIPVRYTTDFMTRKRELYPQLNNPEVKEDMRQVEENLSQRMFFRIPKNIIPSKRIRNGDLICFTSNIPGLGVSHVGIAFHLGDELYFFHASQANKQVEISPVPLKQYLSQHDNITGYMIVRPI